MNVSVQRPTLLTEPPLVLRECEVEEYQREPIGTENGTRGIDDLGEAVQIDLLAWESSEGYR